MLVQNGKDKHGSWGVPPNVQEPYDLCPGQNDTRAAAAGRFLTLRNLETIRDNRMTAKKKKGVQSHRISIFLQRVSRSQSPEILLSNQTKGRGVP